MDENGRFIVREEETPESTQQEGLKENFVSIRKDGKHQQFKRKVENRSKKVQMNEDGSRFRSTRARGDMKKGSIQPYAYIRLDPGLLSKKKKNQSLGKFDNLIGAAKKGAREGSSRRKKH